MRFALLVFTLNELEGMRQVMPEVNQAWVDEILIVDGGSTDGTIEWARSNGYRVHVQTVSGLRHAYRESLELIDADYIIPFSPDGNSLPEKIPELRECAELGFDMVTCSRYLDGARSYDDDWVTSIGNWLFRNIINFVHGSQYTDAMVMFRAINVALLHDLGLTRDQGFSIPEKLFRTEICLIPLLSIRVARAKRSATEIPGDEPPRIGGERKLKVIKWGLAYLFQVFYEAAIDFRRNN